MQHMLKGHPALRDLEHVQVDGPGLTYLFFYDWHGYCGLSKEEALSLHSHDMPMVQITAIGVTTLPTSLSSSVLGINLLVELLAHGLTFVLRLIQVFVTSSGHGYRAPVAPWRTSVVLLPGRGVWFHLGMVVR